MLAQSLGLLLPLYLFYLVFADGHALGLSLDEVNTVGPCYLILVLASSSLRLVRSAPETVWTGFFWLPLQSAVFYGFGPLVEVFGSETTIDELHAHVLALTPEQLWRTNLLSTLGISGLLLGLLASTVLPRWSRKSRSGDGARPLVNPLTLIATFVIGGCLLRYGILKPAAWGQLPITVPGTVSAMGAIVDIGFGLLVASQRRPTWLKRLFWLTWPVHVSLTILSLSKMEIVFALLMPALGRLVRTRKWRGLLLHFSVIAVVYMLAQPWVQYGRNDIFRRTETISLASYGERIELLEQYVAGARAGEAVFTEEQGWWTRLSFAGVQAFAMNAYDTGRPGDSLQNIWMFFIPRFLWPGKPLMLGPGAAFHELVTGHHSGSFLALSIYGDLYWQFGWTGLVLGCPAIGWLLGMMARTSLRVMVLRDYVYIPAVLIALEVAVLGPNKYVANGIIGPLPIFIGYLVLIHVIAPRRKPGQRRTPPRRR